MTTIRTDNAPLSGVWSRDLSASTPLGAEARAHYRGGQAFGDFTAFAGDDVRVRVSDRLDMDAAARAIADHLTETRDNGFG